MRRLLSLLLISLVVLSSSTLKSASVSGTVDYSGGQKGPIVVKLTKTSSGNRSLKLDGDGDHVIVNTVTDLSGPEVSVQYWFRGTSIQSAVRQQNNGWIVAGWNNKHIISNDGGINGISAGNATDGNWHHLVLTWKQGAPNGFSSYLDGRLVESRDAADDPIPAHNAPLYFGAFQGQFEFADGELDEIAVWERALTPEEVSANWFRKLSGDEEGLVGYWDFDDDTADDRSPNEHHGEFMADAFTMEADIPGLDAFSTVELSDPGAFSLDGILDGDGYELSAFLDADGNGQPGLTEPFARYSDNPFEVSGDTTDLSLTLLERPQVVGQPEGTRIGAGETLSLNVEVIGSEPLVYQWRHNGNDLSTGGRISGAQTPNLSISDAKVDDSGAYNCMITNALGETISDAVSVQVIDGGLTLAGTISYGGTKTGPILITAAQVQGGNKVLSLDGKGDYAVTTLTDLSGSELTIEYWFRGSSNHSAVRQQGAAYIVAGWNNRHILSFDGGTLGIAVGESVTDGAWHHVAMTWKAGTAGGFNGGFSSYLDGRLVERRDSADAEIPDMGSQVYFGAFNGSSEFMTGQLDEIAIWERALSEGEIASSWNHPLSGSENGLLGFWNFDDGTGKDLSPLGNEAELKGDAVIVDETIAGFGGASFEGQVEGPGAFELRNVMPGNNFELTAFLDENGNGGPDEGEPSGGYSGNPFVLSETLTTADITLTEPPRFVEQPADARAAVGGEATLSAEIAGSAPLTFQWHRDGAPVTNGGGLSGATTSSLQVANAKTALAGNYTLVVINEKGEATSRAASLDVVANGHTLSGAIAYSGTPAGKIHVTAADLIPGNQVLTLDGRNDFVILPTLKDLSGFELTIQYWFRGRSLQSAVRQQSAAFIVAGWNGQHILSHDGGVGGIAVGDDATDGRWHHVAVTWEIGTVNGFRSYLDGKLIDQRDSVDAEIPFQDAPVYFGAFNGVGEFAEGEFDEIAIWSKALSSEEIQSGWDQPLNGSEEGLIGLWKFDDGQVTDASGNGHDGELKGDAAVVAEGIPGFGGGAFTQVFDAAGPYSMPNLPPGDNYSVFAFVDVNGNFIADTDEPVAASSANPFDLSHTVTGVDLDLGGALGEVRLSIVTGEKGLTVSWPEGSGLSLFSTDDLTQGVWEKVPGVEGSQVTVETDEAAQYFQLR